MRVAEDLGTQRRTSNRESKVHRTCHFESMTPPDTAIAVLLLSLVDRHIRPDIPRSTFWMQDRKWLQMCLQDKDTGPRQRKSFPVDKWFRRFEVLFVLLQ